MTEYANSLEHTLPNKHAKKTHLVISNTNEPGLQAKQEGYVVTCSTPT